MKVWTSLLAIVAAGPLLSNAARAEDLAGRGLWQSGYARPFHVSVTSFEQPAAMADVAEPPQPPPVTDEAEPAEPPPPDGEAEAAPLPPAGDEAKPKKSPPETDEAEPLQSPAMPAAVEARPPESAAEPAPLPDDPGYSTVDDAQTKEGPLVEESPRDVADGPVGGDTATCTAATCAAATRGGGCGAGCGASGCNTCGGLCFCPTWYGRSYCCAPELIYRPVLSVKGVGVGGWIDQGITLNAANPNNRFNGPVTFNDRSDEYQLNQAWVYAQRSANTGGYGMAVGGRFDLCYGTDNRFIVANGLETKWNLGQRFYGLALPQCYVDAAYNDLTISMGHFWSLIGYELAPAPQNFFYSHSYTRQYGEPFTFTGVRGKYDLANNLCVNAGFNRGWNNWDDNNNDLNFMGGVCWLSSDGTTSLAFQITAGNEDNLGVNNRTLYSIVLTKQLTDRWQWVLQHDRGCEENAFQGEFDAEWYSFVNYLYYQINPRWAAGARYEWFADDDGVRVSQANAAGGPPKGMALNGVPSHWNELTLGLRYTPKSNVVLRSELRWDWVDPLIPLGGGPGSGPFDDYLRRSQLLWGTDLIVTF